MSVDLRDVIERVIVEERKKRKAAKAREAREVAQPKPAAAPVIQSELDKKDEEIKRLTDLLKMKDKYMDEDMARKAEELKRKDEEIKRLTEQIKNLTEEIERLTNQRHDLETILQTQGWHVDYDEMGWVSIKRSAGK